MRPVPKAITAVLLASALGATMTIATPAFAQQGRPGMEQQQKWRDGHGMMRRDGWGRGREHHGGRESRRERGRAGPGAFLALACSPRAAERLELGLVRLSYRLDLTDAQRPLFEDLRSTALTEQTTFADACETAREAASDPAGATMVERMRQRLAVQTAHTDALGAVLPKLEALYNSLSDAQKAMLEPRGRRGGQRSGAGSTEPQSGQGTAPETRTTPDADAGSSPDAGTSPQTGNGTPGAGALPG